MTARTGAWHCPPQSVLVGVDFGEASARALALAGFIAAAFDARLRVLHAERFEPPPYFTLEQLDQLETERGAAAAAAASHLTQFAETVSGRAVEAVIADAPPVEAILDAAAAVDLIVLGTHGRRGPGRWWLGSVAERVVRAATAPVLVTRAAATPPRAVFEHVVLVSHDASDASVRECATRLAALAGGRVVPAGPLEQCDAATLGHGSLVVLGRPTQVSMWGFADSVTRALMTCDRPVLFIPSPGDGERG